MDIKTLTASDLKQMQEVELRTVDRSTLRDIQDVEVDLTLPKKERLLDYIRQIGNPYCYRHGKYTIKVSFINTEATLEDRMLSYLHSKCD